MMGRYLVLFVGLWFVHSICFALPPDDKIWGIAVAPRYVWFAYSNGENRVGYPLIGALRRYERSTQNWRTFTIEEMFGTDFPCSVTAVATDGDSRVCVAVEPLTGETLNYACAYSTDNGEHWTAFSETDGIAVNNVDCVAIDPITKTLWLGHQWGESEDSISCSTDEGATWSKLSPNGYNGVTAIQAYNNTVWAAEDHAVIMVVMRTTNLGQTWDHFDYSDSPALYGDVTDICMVSTGEVHCSVYNWTSVYDQTAGYCYTQDGGATWHTHQVQKYDEYCKSVAVADGTVWVAQRWDPPEQVYKSTNYGTSWQGFNVNTELPYDDPFVIRYDQYSDIVWIGFWSETFASFQGGWCWTDDGGATWHTDNPPPLDVTATGVEDPIWNSYD